VGTTYRQENGLCGSASSVAVGRGGSKPSAQGGRLSQKAAHSPMHSRQSTGATPALQCSCSGGGGDRCPCGGRKDLIYCTYPAESYAFRMTRLALVFSLIPVQRGHEPEPFTFSQWHTEVSSCPTTNSGNSEGWITSGGRAGLEVGMGGWVGGWDGGGGVANITPFLCHC
jgi:hypothetical protein